MTRLIRHISMTRFALLCDEISSQAPRIERLDKSKEKKHWVEIKHGREIHDHFMGLDANYTEQCKKELNNLYTDVPQAKLIERGITVPIDLHIISNSQIPSELTELKGLKPDQKKDLGVLCRIIQVEVEEHTKKFKNQTLGYVVWSDAATCSIVEEYLKKWIEEQNFSCDVHIGSITSHQTLRQQQEALKLEKQSGVVIWLTKYMLSRGIDKRTMSFGAGFDTRHEEEFSHTVTRINRRHPNDGFLPEEKIHKPRATWYISKDDTYEYTRDTLAKLQSVGLTCGNIIQEERKGHKTIVPIEKYFDPSYDDIKKLQGSKIKSLFKIRKDDLESLKAELILQDASAKETAEEIGNFIFNNEVKAETVQSR